MAFGFSHSNCSLDFLDGRKLSHLTQITVNIDADRADEVTVTLRGYGPTLELSGSFCK